jgi:hypothetical protein
MDERTTDRVIRYLAVIVLIAAAIVVYHRRHVPRGAVDQTLETTSLEAERSGR